MNYSIHDIAEVISAQSERLTDHVIKSVLLDTRQVGNAKNTLFFAFPGAMNDGHNFISQAYEKGVRNFVITKDLDQSEYKESNFLRVENALTALQELATYHRKLFPKLKILAITGSNGKTIVKEWLYQMLHDKFTIVKSPKSYNSQIGMALSILNIDSHHELGIFEAGISEKGEMKNHFNMLEPSIGIITNIGSAHDSGFIDRKEKTNEKMSLFKKSKAIICRSEDPLIQNEIKNNFTQSNIHKWGDSVDCEVQLVKNETSKNIRKLNLKCRDEIINLDFRFLGLAALENIMHCISTMLYLGVPTDELQERINRVSGLDMRLEMTSGIHGSVLINDAYSADLDSLKMAIEFTNIHAPNRKKVAILSSFDQSGIDEKNVFQNIVGLIKSANWDKLIYISSDHPELEISDLDVLYYPSKEDFLEGLPNVDLQDRAILIKGSRRFEFEKISEKLKNKGHATTLSINLNHLESNLRVYNTYLNSNTGIIAVVKASAYGSGSEEVAQLLERNGVDYLAVAFSDEGVSLRKAGISAPIIVLNPDLNSLKDILHYDLEPEVYDLEQLVKIKKYIHQAGKEMSVHLMLDTGMHRLGFRADNMDELVENLDEAQGVHVKTIFSHLASSEDEADDDYTHSQFELFEEWSSRLISTCCKGAKRHVLNSGGISRFPNRQYDYVRLGIGMYGIDNNEKIIGQLSKVHSLTANIIQVKNMKAGVSIGYNRKTMLEQDARIAVVNIGYADGLMRNIGNGRFDLVVNGRPCPILGNVSMDLTIIDITKAGNVSIGDTVEIFGDKNRLEDLATSAGTIPYEILSRISDRVQRKYVRE